MQGMAEVATGVLHNVGNVLNSVNVSATLLMDELRGSRVSSLVRVSDEIAKHHDDLADFVTVDERGKHLPLVMEQLSYSLKDERDSQVQELQSLIENVEHIKEIVNTQQSLATVGGAQEMLQLVDLVHEAVNMNGPTIARHDVQIVYELDEVPAVSSERHKILQILVNLIGNAVGATKDCEHGQPTINLSVSPDGDNVCVRVRDNGTGIAPENLNRIFTHGFTTKADGHGFGLHSSALAAQDLKGSLSVHSDGPGCGAEFILQIPVREDSECKV
jgi:C4-dicarboxylate-specific signal transduction histidine kinase